MLQPSMWKTQGKHEAKGLVAGFSRSEYIRVVAAACSASKGIVK